MNSSDSERDRFTALVLAGERPAGDPLARALGYPRKALIPVGGEPMLARVVQTLHAAQDVERVVVCGIEARLLASHAGLCRELTTGDLSLLAGGATPSASVLQALESLQPPLLVTTADHPLLRPHTVDEFCRRARESRCDVAVGLVRAETVRAAFPACQRTYLRFREAAYCGANLFALLTPQARRAAEAWAQVEQHRKRPWRLIRALGIPALLRFALRRMELSEALELASARMGVAAFAVTLPYPEVAVDVDKVSDLALAESLLASGP